MFLSRSESELKTLLAAKTLNQRSFLKTAITFRYGLRIRQIFFLRHLQKISHLILPSFAGFGQTRIFKFGPEDWVLGPRSLKLTSDAPSWFSIGHTLHPFELKLPVVVSLVLLVEKKISKNKRKKTVQKKERKEEHIERNHSGSSVVLCALCAVLSFATCYLWLPLCPGSCL